MLERIIMIANIIITNKDMNKNVRITIATIIVTKILVASLGKS